MDLQIYALCEELERNPPPEDPENDTFCESPDSLDEHTMVDRLDGQFRKLLQAELLPVHISGSSGDVNILTQLLRAKEECIQLCVARLSNLRNRMFKAINDEPELIQLAARYYMEKETLVRKLGALVADLPEGALPRDLQKLKDEDIGSIFRLPHGRERGDRIAKALKNNTNGAVS